MGTVRAARVLPGSVHEAETCWYDTSGWPAWVDGLAGVLAVSDGWPDAGSSVVWQSGPAGRGRVTERVAAREPLAGMTVEVSDDSIRGRQTVAFTPHGDDVEVALELSYELATRSLVRELVDRLFIRRAFERSLAETLERFGVELAARHAQAP